MNWEPFFGRSSTDVESCKVWSVNLSEVSSWLELLVKLLKSTNADASSFGACEKVGSFWLDKGQRGFSMADTVLLKDYNLLKQSLKTIKSLKIKVFEKFHF